MNICLLLFLFQLQWTEKKNCSWPSLFFTTQTEKNLWKKLVNQIGETSVEFVIWFKIKMLLPTVSRIPNSESTFFLICPYVVLTKRKKLYSSKLIKNLRNYEGQNSRNSWNHSVKSSLFSPYYFYIDVTKYIEFGIHQIR